MEVLLIGNAKSAEMQPVVCAITESARDGNIVRAADLDAAIQHVQWNNGYPDLAVVLQQWPDEFSPSKVARILGLLPLTRWICCFGAWCESDGRNRDIWPLSIRVAARTAEARLRRELAVLAGQLPPLPATASRDEIFEFDATCDWITAKAGDCVAVVSPDAELRRWIESLLWAGGYSVRSSVRQQPDERSVEALTSGGVQAVVWDADPWNAERGQALSDFCRQHPEVAVVALMNFAHPADAAAVRDCQAHTIVAKLTGAPELLNCVAAAIASGRHDAPASR